jgi:hypothetical protein
MRSFLLILASLVLFLSIHASFTKEGDDSPGNLSLSQTTPATQAATTDEQPCDEPFRTPPSTPRPNSPPNVKKSRRAVVRQERIFPRSFDDLIQDPAFVGISNRLPALNGPGCTVLDEVLLSEKNDDIEIPAGVAHTILPSAIFTVSSPPHKPVQKRTRRDKSDTKTERKPLPSGSRPSAHVKSSKSSPTRGPLKIEKHPSAHSKQMVVIARPSNQPLYGNLRRPATHAVETWRRTPIKLRFKLSK